MILEIICAIIQDTVMCDILFLLCIIAPAIIAVVWIHEKDRFCMGICKFWEFWYENLFNVFCFHFLCWCTARMLLNLFTYVILLLKSLYVYHPEIWICTMNNDEISVVLVYMLSSINSEFHFMIIIFAKKLCQEKSHVFKS